MNAGIEQAAKRVDDVGRRQLVAVVKAHAAAQVRRRRSCGSGSRAARPGSGDDPRRSSSVDQAAEDQLLNLLRRLVGADARIEVVRADGERRRRGRRVLACAGAPQRTRSQQRGQQHAQRRRARAQVSHSTPRVFSSASSASASSGVMRSTSTRGSFGARACRRPATAALKQARAAAAGSGRRPADRRPAAARQLVLLERRRESRARARSRPAGRPASRATWMP